MHKSRAWDEQRAREAAPDRKTAATGSRLSLYIAKVLHLVLIPLFRHFALVLLALQVLPELHLLAGARVAHGAVELATGSDAHGEVARDPLARARVEIRACGKGKGRTHSSAAM